MKGGGSALLPPPGSAERADLAAIDVDAFVRLQHLQQPLPEGFLTGGFAVDVSCGASKGAGGVAAAFAIGDLAGRAAVHQTGAAFDSRLYATEERAKVFGILASPSP